MERQAAGIGWRQRVGVVVQNGLRGTVFGGICGVGEMSGWILSCLFLIGYRIMGIIMEIIMMSITIMTTIIMIMMIITITHRTHRRPRRRQLALRRTEQQRLQQRAVASRQRHLRRTRWRQTCR